MLNNGTNNPMNIRTLSRSFNKFWKGQIGIYKGFAKFSDQEFSFRAACHLIMWSYRIAGCYTVDDIIRRYAPPCENLTISYAKYVSKHSGVPQFKPVQTKYEVASIVNAMFHFENGLSYDLYSDYYDYILRVIDKFNLKFYVK